ncbi:hypothetical protein [Elizabethkingia anophelis]|uniref:hypothetical protein n=1 Tax=Elizabethkingia anophelis TaxID=1117645 RepID=UPI0038924023
MVYKVVANVKVYLTQDLNAASEMFNKLHICRNCKGFKRHDLFDFRCSGMEDGETVQISSDDSCCECFDAADKEVGYWLNKIGEINIEYSGSNDFWRRLKYHQEKGTDIEYITSRK